MARVLVPLAEGFEEIETATIVDVLRRGGVEVVLAGLSGPGPHRGSRGIAFVPDLELDAVTGGFDAIALPGGMGSAERQAADERVQARIRELHASGALVAAICAAPMALDAAGVLEAGRFTCYPGIERRLATPDRVNEPVVDAGAVVTSQGPATAMAFALRLVDRLCGPEVRAKVAGGLLA